MNVFLKEWKLRLATPAADSYKWLFKLGATLGSIGAALLLTGDSIPPQIHTIAGYLLAIGTVIGALAKSTVNDTTTVK